MRSPSRSAPSPQLPFYVQPEPDEALLSWLLRLAARLNISAHALAYGAFDVRDGAGHSQWWRRPHPWLLTHISQTSGVDVDRLREMTFANWAAVYRDDEASERFSGRHFQARPTRRRRTGRLAVCAQCLDEDTEPYLRLSWMIGWIAVCPRHARTLITHCPGCARRLRIPMLASLCRFSASRCQRCSTSLIAGQSAPAHPWVMHLQSALLAAKRHGMTELKGIGRISWPELVAFLDTLLGILWLPGEVTNRWSLLWRISHELHRPRLKAPTVAMVATARSCYWLGS
jgi:hypothetical protein